ncbi:protein FAM227B-like [Neovison vison]|uniref:protein FAM227B-like n=1 Tax=Neovison vison TaxID=452646 RepID=UPI001CEFE55D|nr:protein FAM227B-like [Neogale vison]
MTKILKNPRAYTMPPFKEESSVSRLTTKPITPPAPTYRDIIKEAKRQFARNQKEFRMEKHRINEEIKLLRQRQERIDKELDRLQAKAAKKPYEVKNDFENFLHKLRSEARNKREFLASRSSSSSSTDDYNYEEEECQEKPEMNYV